MLHLSILYSHNELQFRSIKNLLNNSENIFSSDEVYKKIRNYIFGANINIEKDELKEIKTILLKKYFLQIVTLKYRILNWVLSAVSSEEVLPIAANKNSI